MQKHFLRQFSLIVAVLLIITAFSGCQSWFEPIERPSDSQVAPDTSAPSAPRLKVHYIDVWQGDSIFIEFPNGKTMLIDAGKKKEAGKVMDYLEGHSISNIDYLVATHPHEDHIGGMVDVINTFKIGKIYMPKVEHNTEAFSDMLKAIDSKGLKISTAKAGVEIPDTGDGCRAYMLGPVGEKYIEMNNYSAVIRIVYGKTAFLFMGDAEALAEKEIMKQYPDDLKADVLKVGHHGSNTSSGEAFLGAVSPKYAVISVGEGNEYGHPVNSILKRYKDMKINVYRTDIDKNIMISSDGDRIDIKTHVK